MYLTYTHSNNIYYSIQTRYIYILNKMLIIVVVVNSMKPKTKLMSGIQIRAICRVRASHYKANDAGADNGCLKAPNASSGTLALSSSEPFIYFIAVTPVIWT